MLRQNDVERVERMVRNRLRNQGLDDLEALSGLALKMLGLQKPSRRQSPRSRSRSFQVVAIVAGTLAREFSAPGPRLSELRALEKAVCS